MSRSSSTVTARARCAPRSARTCKVTRRSRSSARASRAKVATASRSRSSSSLHRSDGVLWSRPDQARSPTDRSWSFCAASKLETMTQRSGREPDRRHHARILPKGTVTVHALGNAHHGRLANISAGGMYVATEMSLPARLLGRVVDLELRFDGALAAWQRARGRVCRIHADGAAIVFDAPTAPTLLRMIDELTTASHASARVTSVVLIDAVAERRAALATGFRATGCDVVEAATSLEAIVRLGESHFEPDIIAVAES